MSEASESLRHVGLLQLGIGRVGLALAKMVLAQRQQLEQHLGVRLTYLGIADSSGMAYDEAGLADAEATQIIRAKSERRSISQMPIGRRLAATAGPATADGTLKYDLGGILAASAGPFDVRVLVDATAVDGMDVFLNEALQRGWGAVLANKMPLVAPLARSRRLLHAAGRRLRYEATVGAGLPVIGTLRALLDTGDVVHSITGCLSGTLGFLADRLQQGHPFSTAVQEALQRGYTEPDPRQDLSGMDVARKTLILARTMGQELELADVEVEALFPQEMASLSVPEFLASLQDLDNGYQERVTAARARGSVLRYVASVGSDGCQVGWREVGQDDLMAALRGPDNVVRFHTGRYDDNPLLIVGPGAGPECTASGVLADILDLAERSG